MPVEVLIFVEQQSFDELGRDVLEGRPEPILLIAHPALLPEASVVRAAGSDLPPSGTAHPPAHASLPLSRAPCLHIHVALLRKVRWNQAVDATPSM